MDISERLDAALYASGLIDEGLLGKLFGEKPKNPLQAASDKLIELHDAVAEKVDIIRQLMAQDQELRGEFKQATSVARKQAIVQRIKQIHHELEQNKQLLQAIRAHQKKLAKQLEALVGDKTEVPVAPEAKMPQGFQKEEDDLYKELESQYGGVNESFLRHLGLCLELI